MLTNAAIDLAIEALGYQADEMYEGDELNDPSIIAWVKRHNDAIAVMRTLKE